MKKHLLKALVVLAPLSIAMLGGCVSEAQYKEALAQNQRAQSALSDCLKNVDAINAEKRDLEAKLKAADMLAAQKDAQIASLNQERTMLSDKLAELERQLAGLHGESAGPLPAALNAALMELAGKYPDIFEYLPQYGMVRLKSEDLTFDKGSDAVRPGAREALKKLVEVLNRPDAATFNVYVAGHTDDIPISKPETKRRHPDNWYLSVHRAVSVEDVLAAVGLTPGRIGCMGFGEFHPIVDNASGHRGNILNRRVEIWIVPPDRFLTGTRGVAPKAAPAIPKAEEPMGS